MVFGDLGRVGSLERKAHRHPGAVLRQDRCSFQPPRRGVRKARVQVLTTESVFRMMLSARETIVKELRSDPRLASGRNPPNRRRRVVVSNPLHARVLSARGANPSRRRRSRATPLLHHLYTIFHPCPVASTETPQNTPPLLPKPIAASPNSNP
jgi:hypothetical protein